VVCVVDDAGRIIGEKKIPTCPEAISSFLTRYALDRVGIETGPMAVWLWNELHDRGLPIICIDARHANAALKVRPKKTDRNDAAGLAQIIRTGWFKQVRIKSRISYELRSLLAAREVLVRSRVKIENEIRGLLRTFGILFGKAVGGFASRTDQSLPASPGVSRTTRSTG
jgi:transposase